MAALDELSAEFLESHPADAARELDRQPPVAVAGLLRDSPARIVGPVLMAMQPQSAAALLQRFDAARMRMLLGVMPATRATAILRQLPVDLREELLGGLPGALALACRALLRFPADSVGAAMDPAVPILPQGASVADGLELLRTAAAANDGILVVDESRRLSGWCAAAVLLRAEPTLPLRSLVAAMSSVPALMPLGAALDAAAPDGTGMIAVLDTSREPVGVIAVHALRNLTTVRAVRDPASEATTVGFVAAQYWRAVTGLTDIALGVLIPQRGRNP